MEIIDGAGTWTESDASDATYVEQLRRPDLSVGTYSLRAGAADPQSPHTEDEVYVVTAGRGRLTSGERTVDVEAGDVVFVPAGEPHRFHDISDDLVLLVFFGPAEGCRDGGGPDPS